jgi:transcriptional regulator with GAF, ATPase, and Fis domain
MFDTSISDFDHVWFMQDGTLILPLQALGSKHVLLVLHSLAVATWPDRVIEELRRFGDTLLGLLRNKEAGEFHKLLSEISATYINLPIGEIEETLRKDFARLSSALDVDTCSLHIYDETSGRILDPMLPFVWFLNGDSKEETAYVEWHKWLTRNPRVDPKSYQYAFDRLSKGESLSWTQVEDIPEEGEADKEVIRRIGLKSCVAVPIWFSGSVVASVGVGTVRRCRTWPEDLAPRLRLFGEVFVNAIMRKRSEEKLRDALSEIKELKERIEADYVYLKEESEVFQKDFFGIVGKSDALKRIAASIRQVGPTNTTVLILGETGCGKGLLARAVHTASTRKDRPFMQVNCAGLAASLIESELFGHEKGAFTGAISRRIGRFEAANGTTLFLDEIGDLPLELQPKLLRVIEEGEFERVGGTSTIKTNVRVIAATNRDLEKEVEAGRFRRDLWYRLNVFPIVVPPLRERPDDVPLLLSHFIGRYEKDMGKSFRPVSRGVVASLQAYSWPGNVRELRNAVERAVITSSANGVLRLQAPQMADRGDREAASLVEVVKSFEREKLIKALEESNWVIEGPKGTARRLGIKPTTLRRHIKNLNITRHR